MVRTRKINVNRRRNFRGVPRFTPGTLQTNTWSGEIAANQTIAISNKFSDATKRSVKVLTGQCQFNGEPGSKFQFALRDTDAEGFNPSKVVLVGTQPKIITVKNPRAADPWMQEGNGSAHMGWITNLGPHKVYYVINIKFSTRYILEVVTRNQAVAQLPDFGLPSEVLSTES